MSRDNRKLVILFFMLCLASFGLFYADKVKRQRLDPDMFRIASDQQIDRIKISRGLDSIILTNGSGGWKVNERYAADVQRIRLFFAVLDRARPRKLAGGKLKDSLVKTMGNYSFKVEMQEAGQQLFSLLVIGDQKNETTWFCDPVEMIPAEMVIPGYRSNPISVFSTRENDWRDKRVFSFNWRNFTQLQSRFSNAAESDFLIRLDNGLLVMENIPEPDTIRLKNYMDAVQLLDAESIPDNNLKLVDSLKKILPVVQLILNEISGKQHYLSLYSDGMAVRDSTEVITLGSNSRRILLSTKRLFLPSRQLPGRSRP